MAPWPGFHTPRRRSGRFIPGGISGPHPWFGADPAVNQNGEFGRRLAMGDVDGDESADLRGTQQADAAGPNSGSVHLFLGRSLTKRVQANRYPRRQQIGPSMAPIGTILAWKRKL